MSINVNSTTQAWVQNETVKTLLIRMNYVFPLVVVKIDGEVIPKSQYATIEIPDGSTVEVIHLISGG
ncbi:MAG: sulfur carrier protein ThiS [Thermoplasmata archaeon]|nr:sulfur carrier protein ThiS [Thermoplasmata archaeon]